MFLTLEDLAGTLDVVLFPDVYRRVRGFIHAAEPLLVTGVVELDPSRLEPLLRAEKVSRL
jgi:DNA polymerase III alpha subunit